MAKLVTMDNFRRLAGGAGLDADLVASVVRGTVAAMVDTWPQVKAEAEVPSFVATHIEQRLGTLPLIADARR